MHSKHSKIVHNKIEVAIYRLNVLHKDVELKWEKGAPGIGSVVSNRSKKKEHGDLKKENISDQSQKHKLCSSELAKSS